MTTVVTITAHCSPDKEVIVERKVSSVEIHVEVLQDGQKVERCVYDDIVISARETFKKASMKGATP